MEELQHRQRRTCSQLPPELISGLGCLPVEFEDGRTAAYVRKNQFLEKRTRNLLAMDRSVAAGPSLLHGTASALDFPHVLQPGILLWHEKNTLCSLLLSDEGKQG